MAVEVQEALRTLAYFGAYAKIKYLDLIESELGLQLIEPLNTAAAEGLVIKMGIIVPVLSR